MKTIDRYIAAHFVGPFFVGVAAFAGMITGVSEIYWAVQLVVKEGVPAPQAAQAFLLHMPQVIALTMPMAAVFGALMAAGELSGHGEATAMRAGGVGPWRMAAPVLAAGAVVAIGAFVFNEALGPPCNARAARIVFEQVRKKRDIEKPVTLRIPKEGPAQRVIVADRFSIQKQELTNILIVEYKDGRPDEVFTADRAVWRGKQWLLENFVHKQYTGGGYREWSGAVRLHDLGQTPDDLQAAQQLRPEAMSLAQIRQQISSLPAEASTSPAARDRAALLLQHYHIRLATPWAALCFALLGFPLGMRPQRTTTGIGFGLSLAIVFVYYIALNTLRAFGEQGALSPVLAAWMPNILVFTVGLGLLTASAH